MLKQWIMTLFFVTFAFAIATATDWMHWGVANGSFFSKERISSDNSKIDISKLEIGDYYLSFGRPKGSCYIYLDDNLCSKNYSLLNGKREDLLLGCAFSVKKTGSIKEINTGCISQEGLKAFLPSQPVLVSRGYGILVQLYRAFFQIILGPVSSVICLLIGLYFNKKLKSALLFSIGVCYVISSAHYPRLFLDAFDATYLHIFLRFLFFSTVLSIGIGRSFLTSLFFTSHVLLCISTFFLWFTNYSEIASLYKETFYFSSFAVGCLSYRVIKDKLFGEFSGAASALLFAWAVQQPIIRYQVFVSGVGETIAYIVPLGIIILGAIKVIYEIKGQRFSEKIKRLVQVTIDDLNSSDKIIDGIKKLFQLSRSGVPVQILCNENIVHEYHLLDNKEEIQCAMTKRGRVKLEYSLNDTFRKPYMVDAINHELSTILDILESRLEVENNKSKSEFEKKCLSFGHGKHEIKFFSILCDINDYSQNVQRYGNAYVTFVQDDFFASLKSSIEPLGVMDYIRGDEVLIHCIFDANVAVDDLVKTGLGVFEKLQNFTNAEMLELCQSKGFEQISLSSSMCFGDGKVICDKDSVKIEAPHLIEARRLSTAAAMGQCLVRSRDAKIFQSIDTDLVVGDEFPIQVKKDLIFAREVIGIKKKIKAA